MLRFIKNTSFIFALNLILLSNGYAIKELSKDELKNQTARSGISVAIDNAVVYHENTSLKFIDADETDPGSLAFKDIKLLNTINTGYENSDVMGHISLDIANPPKSNDPDNDYYSDPYLAMECNDWQGVSFFKAGSIEINNTDIGSLDISEITFPEWNLYFGAHDSGIDFEAGFKAEINSFKYKYGPASSARPFWLGFDNLSMANSFTGDQENPDDWVSEGRFKIGDFKNNKPATFDIGVRNSDSTPAIFLSAPMSGSVRMKNVHIGNNDFGPAAIDGIKVHSMTIELPGRTDNLGVGN